MEVEELNQLVRMITGNGEVGLSRQVEKETKSDMETGKRCQGENQEDRSTQGAKE